MMQRGKQRRKGSLEVFVEGLEGHHITLVMHQRKGWPNGRQRLVDVSGTRKFQWGHRSFLVNAAHEQSNGNSYISGWRLYITPNQPFECCES
jgi:hypothetical protein